MFYSVISQSITAISRIIRIQYYFIRTRRNQEAIIGKEKQIVAAHSAVKIR